MGPVTVVTEEAVVDMAVEAVWAAVAAAAVVVAGAASTAARTDTWRASALPLPQAVRATAANSLDTLPATAILTCRVGR